MLGFIGLLGIVQGYYSGICTGGTDQNPSNPASSTQRCKTTCQFDQVGKGEKIKFKWLAKSESSLIAEIIVTGLSYHHKNNPYVGLIRFSKKSCGENVIRAIGNQSLVVDIIDKVGHWCKNIFDRFFPLDFFLIDLRTSIVFCTLLKIQIIWSKPQCIFHRS